jgi:hypothetical protein
MRNIKTLNDIRLEQWFELEEYMKTKPSDDQIPFHTISILCEISTIEARKLSIDKVDSLLIEFGHIMNAEAKFQPTFIFNGIKYGFIPNLDEITAGEFVDLQKYEDEFNTRGINMYKIMSILYRPIIDEASFNHYKIEEYSGKLNETFKEMPVDIALGAHVFFCSLGQDLLNYTLKSLGRIKNAKPNKTQTRLGGTIATLFKGLAKNGVGLDGLLECVMETLQGYKQFQHYPYTNVLSSLATKSTKPKYKKK